MTDTLPIEKPTTDLTPEDIKKIEKYVADGLPNIHRVDEQLLYRMTDLYLGGSTYWQISNIMNLPRVMVMYVAHRYDWYSTKKEFLNELQQSITGRVIDSKLVSQDFLLTLTQAWQKKILKKLKRYLETDDEEHTEEIDLKEVEKLLKTIEMIKDLNNEGKNSKSRTPAVGLNLGDGVTIERSGDNKVTITPKEKALGDVLQRLADDRRAEMNKQSKETKKEE
jgi:hypothetical protein